MEIPKFLVGDNTECQDSVFIIHTESPRFILNLDSDDVKWLDEDLPELLGTDDEAELRNNDVWRRVSFRISELMEKNFEKRTLSYQPKIQSMYVNLF